MSIALAAQAVRLFPYERWESLLPALTSQYRENRPCPHILLEDFLDSGIAEKLASEISSIGEHCLDSVQARQRKQTGDAQARAFPAYAWGGDRRTEFAGICSVGV